MPYSLIADLILIIHASYVVFIIGGQVLILTGWIRNWEWPRNFWFRMLHLAIITFVTLETWIGMVCPLTILENMFREKSSQAVYERNFINEWLSHLLFYEAPIWVFTATYTLFFLLVLFTLWEYPPNKKT